MQASLLAVVARPSWWALALAAFLVRGGFVIVLLPIVSLPTTAALTNTLGPTVQDLILGPSADAVLFGTLVVSGGLVALYALLFTGTRLDLALLGEAASDPDLELGWSPANRSATLSLGVRLLAHIPTVVAVAYASIRIVEEAYIEFTSPGDTATALVVRVLGRAVDAPLAVGTTWLLGETVGGLAARRVAAGEAVAAALGRSILQVASPRGLATLAITTTALLALVLPFLLGVATAWQHVRVALLENVAPPMILAAVVLMVSAWVLGVALLGAVLAWRATAWSVQVAPRTATVTQPMLRASEPSPGG
jgi:hypothetical protein